MDRNRHVSAAVIIAFAFVIAPGLVGSGSSAAWAGPGLIVNGSFEQPDVPNFLVVVAGSNAIPGWSVGGVSVDVADENNGFVFGAPYDGHQSLDLDGTPGPGVVFQSFATVPGHSYRVSFAYSNNYTGGSPASATVRAYSASGNLMGPITISHGTSVPNNLNWTTFCGAFTADGTSATIEFASLSLAGSNGGIALDAVEVVDNTDQDCPADVAPCGGNGVVDIDDLFGIINAWAMNNPYYDIAPDGDVNIDDLFTVINSWGNCP